MNIVFDHCAYRPVWFISWIDAVRMQCSRHLDIPHWDMHQSSLRFNGNSTPSVATMKLIPLFDIKHHDHCYCDRTMPLVVEQYRLYCYCYIVSHCCPNDLIQRYQQFHRIDIRSRQLATSLAQSIKQYWIQTWNTNEGLSDVGERVYNNNHIMP